MDIWTYRVEVWAPPQGDERALPNLAGYEVEATDGRVGTIEDVGDDEAVRGCLVVDTGWWIFGKKRVIPAGLVRSIDQQERKVHVGLTKDQIKHAPDFDRERWGDDERSSVAAHYGAAAATPER